MSAEGSIMDAYFRAPPISRSLATAAFTLSIAIYMGVVSGGPFIFAPYYIFKFPPEIWRFVTAFLITGPNMGLLFDSYFLYQYLSQLEVGNPRFPRKEDFVWYLMFVSGVIVTINYIFSLPFVMFLPALVVALCYTATQDQRGMKTNFYFISIPAQLTPYCMILINLVFPGAAMTMLLQVQGLLAAHLFNFLTNIWPQFGGTGKSLLPTPPFLTKVVDSVRGASETIGGVASRAVSGESAARSTGQATGAFSGPLPASWRSRGPGRRLG
ncbi:hypothetical protein GMORB2_4562 [Geosmithia morbida]|uniref:Derlin n=1 Tax=Geosmithia morbida TaxID=1094350 RepID=A0A9P4YQ34_9HYPO|nr:uncharacterized protein GMORB2_4562 [Geosmithia morbida]KAF4119653.1 hypothetical protein GMORB2_4562 [Geosmithia morbida]